MPFVGREMIPKFLSEGQPFPVRSSVDGGEGLVQGAGRFMSQEGSENVRRVSVYLLITWT